MREAPRRSLASDRPPAAAFAELLGRRASSDRAPAERAAPLAACTDTLGEDCVHSIAAQMDDVAAHGSVGGERLEPSRARNERDEASLAADLVPPTGLTQTFVPIATMSEVVEFAVLVRDARGLSQLQLGVITGGGAAQASYEIQLRALGEGRIALRVRGVGPNARETLETRRELARRLRERGLDVVEDDDGS